RTSPVVLLREYKRLRQEIHEFRPHLLHAHYGTMTSFLCAISNTVPLVITFRGSDLNGDPDASFVRSNLGKLLSQISSLREQAVGPIRLIMLDGSVLPELIPSYLNAADCLALASLREGSPNVVKESLACNLPVVATDVGDVAERLEQVRPSRVVTRDVSEFA